MEMSVFPPEYCPRLSAMMDATGHILAVDVSRIHCFLLLPVVLQLSRLASTGIGETEF